MGLTFPARTTLVGHCCGDLAARVALEVRVILSILDPRKNELLAALPDTELARWLPHLEVVNLPRGEVLYQPGNRLNHVYFPTSSIISLLYVIEDGASAEIAVVGREGIVGISLFMGAKSTPCRAVVQCAGQAIRLNAKVLMEAFDRGGPVPRLLLRYTQALITQIAQTSVCNLRHTLEQRLCRLLLLSLERARSKDLLMTHQSIAHLLDVRREGVTEAAGHLQEAGLIRYQRGHITVLDCVGLKRRACGCYAVIRKAYTRLLPATTAT
jgi:CRP-like cAMP-binding protein